MSDFAKIIQMPNPKIEYDSDNAIYRMSVAFEKTYREQIDDAVIKMLYEEYKDSDVEKVFVLSVPEFKRFLMEMLPLWREREGK